MLLCFILYVAVTFRHSSLPIPAWRRIVLRFFYPKQNWWVSYMLLYSYSKYNIIKLENISLGCFIVISSQIFHWLFWVELGCLINTKCPHIAPEPTRGVPSFGVFLKIPNPYFREFRRNRRLFRDFCGVKNTFPIICLILVL